MLQALPNDNFVIVEGLKRCTMSIGNGREGITKTIELQQPEVQTLVVSRRREAALRKRRVSSITLGSLATAPQGQIFVMVIGHRLSQGAVVLAYDSNGDFIQSLRLALPQYPELLPAGLEERAPKEEKGRFLRNEMTHLFPSEIAATRFELFVLDQRGKVAFFKRTGRF